MDNVIVSSAKGGDGRGESIGLRRAQRFKRRKEKVADSDFTVPHIGEEGRLDVVNYRVSQLRLMCKHYELKRSGNKNELTMRVYRFLSESRHATHVQKLWKGYVVRAFLRSKGAIRGRSVFGCTNVEDFLTMEPISKLPVEQLFVFTDADGFSWGFDTLSLYNLVLRDGNNSCNPYDRKPLPKTVAKNLISSIRYGKLAGYTIDVKFETEDVLESMSPQRRLEMRTIDLCQRIDALGNHTDVAWFLSMNSADRQLLLRELWDIWHYRASIPYEVKRRVCPPRGDPFANTELSHLGGLGVQTVWRTTLSILERFVNAGIDNDAKSLGAMYVLTAVTLVSAEAADALPWLYQSAAHFS
jgi:hypothetical protein